MKKLAVMVSGGGTNLQSIIDGIANGKIAGEIVLVISSKPGVYALTRAENCLLYTSRADPKAGFDPGVQIIDGRRSWNRRIKKLPIKMRV